MGSKNLFHLGKKKKFIYRKIYKDRFCSNVQKYTHTRTHAEELCICSFCREYLQTAMPGTSRSRGPIIQKQVGQINNGIAIHLYMLSQVSTLSRREQVSSMTRAIRVDQHYALLCKGTIALKPQEGHTHIQRCFKIPLLLSLSLLLLVSFYTSFFGFPCLPSSIQFCVFKKRSRTKRDNTNIIQRSQEI